MPIFAEADALWMRGNINAAICVLWDVKMPLKSIQSKPLRILLDPEWAKNKLQSDRTTGEYTSVSCAICVSYLLDVNDTAVLFSEVDFRHAGIPVFIPMQ